MTEQEQQIAEHLAEIDRLIDEHKHLPAHWCLRVMDQIMLHHREIARLRGQPFPQRVKPEPVSTEDAATARLRRALARDAKGKGEVP
jgi:hypothetical protein